MSAEAFFSYARERYKILLKRRAGEPWPWTDDPVLQKFYYCNVFREDDRTTMWLREQMKPWRDKPEVLLATVIFRWFNRIETGEILAKASNNLLFEWNGALARKELAGVKPVVTGAYMIKSPDGMKKMEGVVWNIDEFIKKKGGKKGLQRAAEYFLNRQHSIQDITAWLAKSPFMGPFLAYEVSTDLCHTKFLENAPDRMTWANFGPGATRGAGVIVNDDPEMFDRGRHQKEILLVAQEILEMSQKDNFWPSSWPKWEMRDVEHGFCEMFKYSNAKRGGRLKRLYRSPS